MASSVYYKFKAQREESKISFDGTGISVFDLKKEVILANNLKDNRDVDLLLYDPSSNQGVWNVPVSPSSISSSMSSPLT